MNLQIAAVWFNDNLCVKEQHPLLHVGVRAIEP